MSEALDLAIVGAGPAGLAVAIAAAQAGLDYEVIEKGTLVNSIYHFPAQMTFFTTPELLEIGGLPFVTPYDKPTRAEGLKYYRRVAERYALRVSLGEEVVSLASAPLAGDARFDLRTRGARGEVHRRARHVVLATGYYDNPNRLGIPGEDLPHVTHYYDDPHPFWGRSVVVVGGKNSAAIAALELFRAGARVTLVHRHAKLSDSIKYWIRPDVDNRIKEGSITARFERCVSEIRERSVLLSPPRELGTVEEVPADHVFLLTGYSPDPRLLRECGVELDPVTLIPRHDPETLETSVPGLFVAGALVSGKMTSRIFIENGRFHGEAIVRAVKPPS